MKYITSDMSSEDIRKLCGSNRPTIQKPTRVKDIPQDAVEEIAAQTGQTRDEVRRQLRSNY